jgi:hypothetical protein
VGLVATLPWQSAATGGVIFALGLLVWALKKKRTFNH